MQRDVPTRLNRYERLRYADQPRSAIQGSGRYRDTIRPGKRQIRGTTGQFHEGNRVGTAVANRGLQDERWVRWRKGSGLTGKRRGNGFVVLPRGKFSVNGAVDR